MKFALMIYEDKAQFAARTDAQRQGPYWGAYTAYFRALTEAGVMAGGNGLQPPTNATTVRMKAGGGSHDVQDGPYADTKEQLGGFFVVDVPSLDVALQWAARVPVTSGGGGGSVEVRPVLEM